MRTVRVPRKAPGTARRAQPARPLYGRRVPRPHRCLRVGDAAADALAALPALTQLALSGTSVGEGGARALARGRLRSLELHDSAGILAGAARALAGLADSLVALDLTLCPARPAAPPARGARAPRPPRWAAIVTGAARPRRWAARACWRWRRSRA